MKHGDLFLLRSIFSSDDDGNPVEDLFAGYDDQHNLIVLLEHIDYDEPENNCHAYAIVNKDEAFDLARRLKVPMTELPDLIGGSVDDEYFEIINPSPRQVRNCFKEILDNFTIEKCRFRLIRKAAASGYTCF